MQFTGCPHTAGLQNVFKGMYLVYCMQHNNCLQELLSLPVHCRCPHCIAHNQDLSLDNQQLLLIQWFDPNGC
jgi:hypothetical protein